MNFILPFYNINPVCNLKLLQVEEYTADIGSAALSMSYNRNLRIDFGPRLSEHEIGLAATKPKPKESYKALLISFDFYVWMGLGITILLVFSAILAFKTLINPEKQSDQLYQSWSLAIALFFNEALPIIMFKTHGYFSLRGFLGLWMVLGLVFAMAYKSNLLANMMADELAEAIDSPEKVVASGLPVFMTIRSMSETAIVSSPLKVYQDLYQINILAQGSAYPLGQYPDNAEKLIHAGHAFKITTRSATETEPGLFYISQSLYVGPTSWIFPKGSRIQRELVGTIVRIQSAGLYNHWLDEEWYNRLPNRKKIAHLRSKARHAKINVSNILPSFIGLGIGLALSLMSLGCELFQRKCNLST